MAAHPTFGWETMEPGTDRARRTLGNRAGDVTVNARVRTAGRTAGFLHIKARRKRGSRWLHTRLVLNNDLGVEAMGVGKRDEDAYKDAIRQLRAKGLMAEGDD
jgi:hypothetical protein